MQALEAEQGVIYAVLSNNSNYEKLSRIVSPKHFQDEANAYLFEVMGNKIVGGEVASISTLLPLIRERLQDAKAYLTEILSIKDFAIISSPIDFAKAVREAWCWREMQAMADDVLAISKAPTQSLAELANSINTRVETVTSEVSKRGTSRSNIGLSASELFKNLNDKVENGLTTGIRELDEFGMAFKPGQLVILGGRPGMGKSTAGLAMAIEQAKRGHGVGFFSLEMTNEELSARALSYVTERMNKAVNYSWIKPQGLRMDQDNALGEAVQNLLGLPILLDDYSPRTVGSIAAAARHMSNGLSKDGKKLEVIYVDHLGLIKPSDKYGGNKVAETGEISGALKSLAKELGVTIVALCQLSRNLEGRDDKRPNLSDLRYSGDIEQDADIVVMLYREAYYLAREARNNNGEALAKLSYAQDRIELLVEKYRGGETGTVEAYCNIATSTIGRAA
jgi:replicative DNA helicase